MKEIIRGTIIDAPALGEVRYLPGGCLVLEDGVIREVLETLPEGTELPVTDYGDCLILQSFADMHLHGPQYPLLGTCMDVPLLEWLNRYAFPTESRFADPDYAREVYAMLAAELVDNGTTRVVMFSSLHTEGTWLLMEALERAGITGYVGKVNMDRNGSPVLQETTEQSKRETLRWLEGCERFSHIRPILTPRFTPSCTDELMAWLGELAGERGLCVQSHLSENTSELAWVSQLHPDCQRYWETYAKYGLWKDHTVMAHCVYSDETERRAMREAHVLAVHCPDSNTNVCSGVAPVRQMLEEGVWVALGSDIAGGDHLPMLEVMSSAVRISKVRYMTAGDAPLSAAEAYYLGTTAGHRYFGAGDGFAVGDRLHAVVVDDSTLGPKGEMELPLRLERAIYRAKKEQITAVYSDGRKIKGR
ncbi:MAG: amidohydrolase family protein [Clostridiales bacterium]|nr:amidohydrolase family protein [Clostridiales bacterium]